MNTEYLLNATITNPSLRTVFHFPVPGPEVMDFLSLTYFLEIPYLLEQCIAMLSDNLDVSCQTCCPVAKYYV